MIEIILIYSKLTIVFYIDFFLISYVWMSQGFLDVCELGYVGKLSYTGCCKSVYYITGGLPVCLIDERTT